MNSKEKAICRLCFKVAEDGFEFIDEITKNMFNVLSLKVNLDVSQNPIICNDCMEVIEKSSFFKSKCIDIEKYIVSLSVGEAKVKFEDLNVCRLCMDELKPTCCLSDILTNESKFLEMFAMYMPEIDLNRIKNPVICIPCKENLECYLTFMQNCLHIEKKIKVYSQNEGSNGMSQVKLSDLQISLSKYYLDLPKICDQIKQEAFEETGKKMYDDLIETKDELDIKDHNFTESAFESSLEVTNEDTKYDVQIDDVCLDKKMSNCDTFSYETTKTSNCLNEQKLNHKSARKIHSCALCPYKTKYIYNIRRHSITHKDISDIEMYKCTECTYQARYKDNLRNHMLCHMGSSTAQTYNCTWCTYRTKHKGKLSQHVLKHKDTSEIQMYNCPICTYQSRYKGNIKKHLVKHKNVTETETSAQSTPNIYKCTTCPFETKHKKSLKTHTLIHKDSSEVEMYKCAKCKYEAKVKSHLKRHILSHSSEAETYRCTMCTYEVKSKRSLTNHMTRHKNVLDKKHQTSA